ncbi:hypothetical protein OBV_33070 [Oscillibacter valericigenes Sjm18-20]|nr:hypothetical protein OBV_33070 [Oscillibacter valericigenes Sjm18-20]
MLRGGMYMTNVGTDAAKGKSTVCIMKSYGKDIIPSRDIGILGSLARPLFSTF